MHTAHAPTAPLLRYSCACPGMAEALDSWNLEGHRVHHTTRMYTRRLKFVKRTVRNLKVYAGLCHNTGQTGTLLRWRNMHLAMDDHSCVPYMQPLLHGCSACCRPGYLGLITELPSSRCAGLAMPLRLTTPGRQAALTMPTRDLCTHHAHGPWDASQRPHKGSALLPMGGCKQHTRADPCRLPVRKCVNSRVTL